VIFSIFQEPSIHFFYYTRNWCMASCFLMTVSPGIYMCDIFGARLNLLLQVSQKKREFTTRAAAHHIDADYDDQNRNLTAKLFYLFTSQSASSLCCITWLSISIPCCLVHSTSDRRPPICSATCFNALVLFRRAASRICFQFSRGRMNSATSLSEQQWPEQNHSPVLLYLTSC